MNSVTHRRRLAAERRFQCYGKLALGFSVLLLVLLLGSLIWRGVPGFMQTQIRLPIAFDASQLALEKGQDMAALSPASYNRLMHSSLKKLFPNVKEHAELRMMYNLIGSNAGIAIKTAIAKNPQMRDKEMELWLPASSAADLYNKEHTPGGNTSLSAEQIAWLASLKENNRVRTVFNRSFLSHGDSRTPEQAGFLSAMVGSGWTLLICLLVAFPLGVMTAVYLEEFARPSRWVELIEVNINNLAAVPSIVFGLLGLAFYINTLHLPRSAPLVGGLTLALMILPVIIIATRAALTSIPQSIRDAALALGASPVQTVWQHILPLAMPGIMTGTILGMARTIGETAPLLMIGMVAFVADIPSGPAAPSTVMPVQIYLWASSPEAGFAEKTASGILVLLVLLLAMNALAIILRKRFEVRW